VRLHATAPDGKAYTSLLHLVDLAGSERVDKSEVTGQQLKVSEVREESRAVRLR
jgi:kinesin family protein C2/C3